MTIPTKTQWLLLSGLLIGTAGLQGQITLASFAFNDAPTSIGTGAAITTSAATTLAPGFGASSFTVVRNNTTAENQSGIANVDGSSGVGAAQISGQQNYTYHWQDGTSNYFEFTIDFGGVSASAISFDELVLNGRTAVEWSNTGALNAYNNGRGSSITVRSSLDGYAANIGGDITPSFNNINNDWTTTTIDLSGLVLLGTEESITFRIYTRTNTPTATGNSLFHRTQLNSVEVLGAIPEPST